MKVPKLYSNSRLTEIVNDYIHSERDRAVLLRKFCDNRTIEQLAEEFELSDSQIKRIIYRDSMTIFSIMARDELKKE